ncbi:MAG: hypothetical protein WCD86_01795 [Ktedonobacteraceae bacterium]
MQHQRRESPQWQPISRLPLIATHIDGMLEAAMENYETLQEARPKPHVLDDETVKRVIDVFTTQQNDLWLFDEQLRRWKAGQITARQRKEIERLVEQMAKLRQVITDILHLANELKEGTIEKQLAKSDAQLGLEFLLRRLAEQ